MWEQFTERAKQVISGAREEAVRLRSDCVQTEHLLLALCRDPESTAVRALAGLGVDVPALTAAVERELKPGTSAKGLLDDIVLTPRAKRVLGLAVGDMHRMNDKHIGTGHLLLGLFEEGEGVAARLLRNMKIDWVCMRDEIVRLTADEEQ